MQYAPKNRQTDGLCSTPPLSVCDQEYGLSIGRGSFNFTPGAWTHVKQTVALNTPGQQDGSFMLEVNGQQVIDRSDIFYRDVASAIPPDDSNGDSDDPEGDPDSGADEDDDSTDGSDDSDGSGDSGGQPSTTQPTQGSSPTPVPTPSTTLASSPVSSEPPAQPAQAQGVPADAGLGSILGPLLNGLQLEVLPGQDSSVVSGQPSPNPGAGATAPSSSSSPTATTSTFNAYDPYLAPQPTGTGDASGTEEQEEDPKPIGFTGLFFR